MIFLVNLKVIVYYNLLPLFQCYDSQLILSSPHFWLAEQELENFDGGLNPDPELHAMQIDVEPNTGMAIQLHKRIMVRTIFCQEIY